MSGIYSKPYLDEIALAAKSLDIDSLKGKTIALSGATGLIGSYLIDTVLSHTDFPIRIHALVRNRSKASERFSRYESDTRLLIHEVDLMKPIEIEGKIDYVIHAASMTSPHEYATMPIEIMKTNIVGSDTMLSLADVHHARYLFVSSTEIYGTLTSETIKEDELGYLNLLDPRSAYNESKRAGETLAVSYASQRGLDIVIARLSRVYGPTQKDSDRKAMSQFLFAASRKEPIVIKSAGTQRFSYTYVSDAVSALVFLLTHGQSGKAYNVASEEVMSLKEIAMLIGKTAGIPVTFDLAKESGLSYSKTLQAVLDVNKIKTLGWLPKVSLTDGICRTLSVWASR